MGNELNHSYSIFIQASPEQVWTALTDPECTVQYNFHSAAKSDWRPGSDYAMTSPDDGSIKYDGKVLVSEPPRFLSRSGLKTLLETGKPLRIGPKATPTD